MGNITYMAISNDKFEMPLAVGSAKELAKYLGLKSPQAIYKAAKVNAVCRKNCRVIRLS